MSLKSRFCFCSISFEFGNPEFLLGPRSYPPCGCLSFNPLKDRFAGLKQERVSFVFKGSVLFLFHFGNAPPRSAMGHMILSVLRRGLCRIAPLCQRQDGKPTTHQPPRESESRQTDRQNRRQPHTDQTPQRESPPPKDTPWCPRTGPRTREALLSFVRCPPYGI